MKIKSLLLALLGWTSLGFAVDGLYLGGQIGHVALTGSAATYNNTIGFAADLGFRANPLLDLMFSSQYSSHPGGANGLSVYTETITAQFHVLEANDFDWSLGAGPGFYFFKYSLKTDTMFGLNFGSYLDVKVGDNLKLGLGIRYHKVFRKEGDLGDNLWTLMMRVGYTFGD
ncbi:MAG: porin family protein [Deltaproteobacteria bacterium]|nr:porin family protein [Deltaproteobacteria bacterium]